MTDPSWYSILPPIIAIVLAIWTKQVILSLFSGIWMGFTLMNGFNPLVGATEGLNGLIHVFSDAGDTRVVIFTLLIGSLIATIVTAATSHTDIAKRTAKRGLVPTLRNSDKRCCRLLRFFDGGGKLFRLCPDYR